MANTSNAYRAGRILGDIPIAGRILQPAASLVEGLTTRIPRGAMSFVGLEAADDVNDLVDLFRIAGVPSYVRTMWKNAILQSPTGGTRLEAYASLIDSVSTAAGFSLTKAGDDFIDTFLEHSRQIYSLGPAGRHTVDANGLLNLPYGVRPIADMATMIAVPDLHLMRRATQQGFIMRAALGIPESTPILAFQNKFWKPAVLLRVGFIVRNVSEEMLAMFVRYGTGRWAQELVGRQVGQREAFDDAFNKAMRKGQNQGLSKFDEHVLRKRYDVPVPLRPVARAIERMDNGRPWLRVLERYQGFLEDTIAYSSNRFYDWAINGYGGSIASAARRAALPVDREGATANLTNIAKRLAFGNPYSMRRMIIGGVNPDIFEFAKLFESTYLKSIMDQVGTTNLAPWDRSNLRNRAEEAYRTIVDENGNPSVQLVKVLSERDLATASNAVPGIQPHQEGVLSRRQELLDDEVVDAALGPFALVYNADLRPAVRPDGTMTPGLTPENLKTILSEYAQKAFGKQARWDDDLLHLWTIMHEGIFNRQRFDIKLRAMTFSDEAIEDMASPGLQDWARRRNEMVKLIRTAFPGQTQPTWAQLVDAVLGDTNLASHLDAEFVRARNNPLFDVDETVRAIEDPALYPEPKVVGKPTGTMIDVTGIPLMDVLPGKVGFTRLRDQIEALSRMSEA
ncbi:MAG TPA: hypothetical protein DCF63_02715, partial [Planctomycetaceae bacterium]|nr:hypothetical protein [Planctomycetaceae bacterium]